MPDLISQWQAMATMAALSPEKFGAGKKMAVCLRSSALVGVCRRPAGTSYSGTPTEPPWRANLSGPSGIYVSSVLGRKDPDEEHLPPQTALLNALFADTPPAKTMDLVSGYFLWASWSFSSKMSMAVFWKLAAKSAICLGVSKFFNSWEG